MADSTEATQTEAEELKQLQEKLAAQEAANRLYLEWYYTKYEPWAAQVKADAERRAANPAANPNPANPANLNGNWWKNWDTYTPQQREKLVLPLTLALMVVAVTFPPWRIANPFRQESFSRGFVFLLEPPASTAYIDWSFLIVELLLIGLVGGLVWVFIRGNKK